MLRFRALLRAGLTLLLLSSGCAREKPPGGEGAAAAPEPAALTAEQMERPSPSAAAVAAFSAVCAEPARSRVAREAARRGFEPVPLAALREEMPGAALPPDGEAWRGPEEVGGAVLLWDAATATCEMRALGLNPLVVDSEFAKLPQTLEEAGASVMRLPATPAPAGGAARTRQMLLVSPGAAPERARVLWLGEDGARGKDAVVLSARGVAAR